MDRLLPTPVSSNLFAPLAWQHVAEACTGARLGRSLVYLATVDSTNLHARALARDGAPDGTVVVADEQTKGRGRLGRRWTAPPCSGVAASTLLRLPAAFPLYTLPIAAALAAAEVIRSVVGDACTLKWPNDILVAGRKVGGILLDVERANAEGGDRGWVVIVGIGINVHAVPLLPDVALTCLADHTMAVPPRDELLIALLAALETYVDRAADDPGALVAIWRDRLDTLGQRVRAVSPGIEGTIEGIAVDVDADGALLVRLDSGEVRTVRAADVTLTSRP